MPRKTKRVSGRVAGRGKRAAVRGKHSPRSRNTQVGAHQRMVELEGKVRGRGEDLTPRESHELRLLYDALKVPPLHRVSTRQTADRKALEWEVMRSRGMNPSSSDYDWSSPEATRHLDSLTDRQLSKRIDIIRSQMELAYPRRGDPRIDAAIAGLQAQEQAVIQARMRKVNPAGDAEDRMATLGARVDRVLRKHTHFIEHEGTLPVNEYTAVTGKHGAYFSAGTVVEIVSGPTSDGYVLAHVPETRSCQWLRDRDLRRGVNPDRWPGELYSDEPPAPQGFYVYSYPGGPGMMWHSERFPTQEEAQAWIDGYGVTQAYKDAHYRIMPAEEYWKKFGLRKSRNPRRTPYLLVVASTGKSFPDHYEYDSLDDLKRQFALSQGPLTRSVDAFAVTWDERGKWGHGNRLLGHWGYGQPRMELPMENPATSAVHGRGWIQESYETAGGEAKKRSAALRKLGYQVSVDSMGRQVTPVGSINLTMVSIRPGTSGDAYLEAVPVVEEVRWNPDAPAAHGHGGQHNPVPSPVVTEIARQLANSGMSRTSVAFVAWDDDTLKVSKNLRGALIRYNRSTDLYDVTPYDASGMKASSPFMSAVGVKDWGTGLVWGDVVDGIGVEQLWEVVEPMLHARRNPGGGFYVMTWGGGSYGSVAWYPTREEAERHVQGLKASGAWSGKPPKVEASNPAAHGNVYFVLWAYSSHPGVPVSLGFSAEKYARRYYELMRHSGVTAVLGGGSGEVYRHTDGITDELAESWVDQYIKGHREENPADGAAVYAVGNNQLLMEAKGLTQTEAVALLRRRPLDDLGQHNFIWKSDGTFAGDPSWHKVTVRKSNPRSVVNPTEGAAALYEEFHGVPSESETIITEEIRYHGNLAELGTLVEIKVETLSGYKAVLTFESDPPLLCSSEDGKQLYLRGGDQSLDLDALHMSGDEWLRDSMVIGPLIEFTYRTKKEFDGLKKLEYFHKAGEESGVRPDLLYDVLNNQLSVTGGQYGVHPEGVVN